MRSPQKFVNSVARSFAAKKEELAAARAAIAAKENLIVAQHQARVQYAGFLDRIRGAKRAASKKIEEAEKLAFFSRERIFLEFLQGKILIEDAGSRLAALDAGAKYFDEICELARKTLVEPAEKLADDFLQENRALLVGFAPRLADEPAVSPPKAGVHHVGTPTAAEIVRSGILGDDKSIG